jgi:hypothetical protein
MSTKASTAALDRIGQRLLLPRRRVPRHPASGQKFDIALAALRRQFQLLNRHQRTTIHFA